MVASFLPNYCGIVRFAEPNLRRCITILPFKLGKDAGVDVHLLPALHSGFSPTSNVVFVDYEAIMSTTFYSTQQQLAAMPSNSATIMATQPNSAKSTKTKLSTSGTRAKSQSTSKTNSQTTASVTPPLQVLVNNGKKLPKIVAFTNQKGGVGKSTCSVHLVDWMIRQGCTALLIDADGQQCSSPWASELGHPFEIIGDPDLLFKRLFELREDPQYDMIVVDGPGNASETTKTILNCVDLALIPIKESLFDIVSTGTILDYVRQSQLVRGGNPKAALFFSNVDERTLAYRDAKTSISQCQVVLLDIAIYQRTCITDSPGQARTVFGVNRKDMRESANRFEKLFVEALEVYNA